MKNQLSSIDEEEENELPNSVTQWWRRTKEFDIETGKFKIDLSDLSKITPRIKLLREMERLNFVAESQGFDNLIQKLVSYKSGDLYLPIGGIKKEEMDIPPAITLLLLGLIGSGKSSVINMMYTILGRSGLIPFAQTSNNVDGSLKLTTTMYLEEHNVVRSSTSGFCVYDTRGIDVDQLEDSLEEVSTWINDGVSHNQVCSRPPAARAAASDSLININGCSRWYTKRKVNCVMVVANLAEINEAFLSGQFKSLQAIRDIFQLPCINTSNGSPILVLTHGDKLKSEERLSSRLQVCEYLGISETTGAYDIACLSELGILPSDSDPVTAFAVTESVYRCLIVSDRSHRPKLKFMDRITLFMCWFMSCVSYFFSLLARFFSRFEHNHKKLKF